ncbi:MAG: LemA family protein, partial [Myxococcota bacterium]
PSDPSAIRQLGRAEGELTGALGRLLAVSESYPGLKANESMIQLSEELATTENRVAFARQAYNDAVMTFNTATETFPNALIARRFGFGPAELLQLEDPAVREAPQVHLG